jgi:hypothetical protein
MESSLKPLHIISKEFGKIDNESILIGSDEYAIFLERSEFCCPRIEILCDSKINNNIK